jgi:hypothetical protein
MRPSPRVFLGVVTSVVLLASCSASPGSQGLPAGSSAPTSASEPPPTAALPAPVGQAPTISIVGNHFVDGHGDEIRLLGVNFADVEGACVDPGFQQGATDQHPGAVFDYQGPNPVAVPGRDDVREAAASIAAAEGVGVEGVTISNDRPVGVVARDVMTFLGWL